MTTPTNDSTAELFGTAPTERIPAPEAAQPLPRPRTRFGAIAWGLILCAAAGVTLWFAADETRRTEFANWATSLTPGTAGLIVLVILGGLLLLWGSLAAIRRSQEGAPRL